MALSKKDRDTIFDKYGGRCAYCGCELGKGWHADHLKPVRRKMKYCHEQGRHLPTGEFRHPKRNCLDNYNPSCASCNINKHSMSLEGFRALVAGFLTSLNRDSTQYKIAKRYGFIVEVVQPVVFYFEKVASGMHAPEPAQQDNAAATENTKALKDMEYVRMALQQITDQNKR